MDKSTRTILANAVRAAEEARRALEALNQESTRDDDPGDPGDVGPGEVFIACSPRQLPKSRVIKAAKAAIEINPANAPHLQGPMGVLASGLALEPLHIALLTAKYWGPGRRQLTVSFMEQTAADLRERILAHMNAWSKRCGISFVFTQSVGDVRIARGPGGYWSYLGTDITQIPRNRPTMNLENFSVRTPESEYRRVVRHETGHTLGFPHEHMRSDLVARIDPQKAVAWFAQTQGWDQQTVQQQVLTPLDERSLMSTPADQTSIMCYQLPGAITKDGRPIPGGADINDSDYQFAAKVYPPAGGGDPGAGGSDEDLDWLV